MEDFVQLLLALAPIVLVLLLGCGVVHLGRRWPWVTLALLLPVITLAAGALGYAWHEGFEVRPDTRQMTFGSELGRWCFTAGGLGVVLGVPALPLVAIARSRNGGRIGPVGAQWVGVLFAYFLVCVVWSAVVYSLLTGIIK
jgi:hypothetical protein